MIWREKNLQGEKAVYFLKEKKLFFLVYILLLYFLYFQLQTENIEMFAKL